MVHIAHWINHSCCPNCGCSKEGVHVYKCTKCSKLYCNECSIKNEYKCPKCDFNYQYRDYIGVIVGLDSGIEVNCNHCNNIATGIKKYVCKKCGVEFCEDCANYFLNQVSCPNCRELHSHTDDKSDLPEWEREDFSERPPDSYYLL